MTPAERKFASVEAGLMRAQCLVRALRDLCDCGLDNVDPALWGGIYIIIGEAESAVDAAADLWTEGHKLAVGK